MTDDQIPPHDDEDPRERELSRRSNTPSVGIWVVLCVILLLGVAVYLASAVL